MDPTLALAYNALGIAYTQKGRIQDAVDQFKKATEIDPGNCDALLNLGNVNLSVGNYDLALDNYLIVLARGHETGVLQNNIAAIYLKKGEYEDAWEHAQRARSLGFAIHPQFLEELNKKRAEKHK